jgi:hypothetical protein
LGKVIQVPFGDILLYCIALGLTRIAVALATRAPCGDEGAM